MRYTCYKNHVDFRVRSYLIYFCLWHIYTAAPARLPIFVSVLPPKAEAKRGVYSQKNRHAHMTDRPRNGRRTDGRLIGRLTAFLFLFSMETHIFFKKHTASYINTHLNLLTSYYDLLYVVNLL